MLIVDVSEVQLQGKAKQNNLPSKCGQQGVWHVWGSVVKIEQFSWFNHQELVRLNSNSIAFEHLARQTICWKNDVCTINLNTPHPKIIVQKRISGFWPTPLNEWGTGGTNPICGADTQLGDDGDVDRAMGNIMPCEWRIWTDVVALSGRKWRHIHCFSQSCASAPPFALVSTLVPHCGGTVINSIYFTIYIWFTRYSPQYTRVDHYRLVVVPPLPPYWVEHLGCRKWCECNLLGSMVLVEHRPGWELTLR
jgi:hypothetical protein